MKKKKYTGPERRSFVRIGYAAPINYKICKKETINKLLDGYTCDISASGLSCNIKNKVRKNDILWLSFDRATLSICQDLERRSFVYQNGIIGKVVRIKRKKDNGSYDIGIQFITREEKNLTNIYPKVHFLKLQGKEVSNNNEPEEKPQEQIDEERQAENGAYYFGQEEGEGEGGR